MKKAIPLIFLLIAIVLIAIILLQKDEWMPFYYPEPDNLIIYMRGPTVKSLEECRAWIEEEAIMTGQLRGEYDYECGLNCKIESNDLYLCEETKE